MPEALQVLDGWLLRTTLGGGVVLLIGSLWMAFTRQPVQRQRIGEFALLAALLVALPAALPSWWSLPGSSSVSATTKALFGQPISANRSNQFRNDSDLLVTADSDIETDEEAEAKELINSIYTLNWTEKDDTEGAKIVGPPDCSSENNCTKGETLSMFFLGGRWSLRLIGFAYLGLVIVLLIRCSIGYYGLWRFWRRRRPAPAHVHTALAELEPDPAHRPRIGVNSLVHGPVSYGLWKPTILLPPSFCNEGDPEKLRWILAHELTHLRRRDAWGCLLLALGGALYFHVPWFWWMKRHVRLAQEYLADAAAAQIANAVEYAQYLVSLTSLTSRPSLASSQAAGVFESPSDLYRRVHMLLHQRNAIERGAPRWWTLTAAASFLTLAACTAGVQLYADEPTKRVFAEEPAKREEIKVIVVSDGDDKGADKKTTETRTVRVVGKAAPDGKTLIWTTDDGKDGPHVIKIQGEIAQDKQKALEEALKKIDRMLEKSSRQLDDNTRTQLEELKKMLRSMKDTNKMVWLGQADAAREGQVTARARLFDDATKSSEDAVRAAKIKAEVAKKLAATHRDEAVVAEKLARAAQEKALIRWREATDGKDKDEAIKELEKAIAEKERALRSLKSDMGKVSGTVRSFDVLPLVQSKDAVTTTGRGRLGVVTADIDSNLRAHLDLADGQGLMLNEVIDSSPAWNQGNGLRSSDILVEFAGKKVPADTEQFRELVGKLGEGNYTAVVYRKGKKLTIGGIKLPAVEKNKKVVLEGNLINAGDHLVAVVPHVDKLNHDLVVTGQLKADGKNPINLTFKPEVKVLGDALKTAQAAELKALADHDVALELAKVQPLKEHVANLTLTKPIDETITVDGKGVLRLDADNILKSVQGDHITLNGVAQLAPAQGTITVSGQPAHIVSRLATAQAQSSGKPRLGVSLEAVPDAVASQIELADDRGLYVAEVTDGSAAQKAGILKNDILIEFADKPVTKDHPAFTKLIKDLKPGKYTATVVRKGKEIRIRGIELTDVKAASEDRKVKAKEWIVEGDNEKTKEEENAKPKAKARKEKDKEKEDFFPNAGGNRFNFVPAQGNMSVTINNDSFTAKKTDGDRTILVTGAMVNGKTEVKNITIKNDDGEKKYKAVKDVPEEDRADVEKMLTSFKGNVFNGGNNLRWGNGQFNNAQFNKQFENQLKDFEKAMKQLGEGNPGFEQLERELERMREQLKKIRGIKEDENK